ncbi:MAG: thioredoxin domain-containing protein [Corynebacteriales bacterium]|nr:thioredoxin domain-containing protein [Mycobacteriales bacterium]
MASKKSAKRRKSEPKKKPAAQSPESPPAATASPAPSKPAKPKKQTPKERARAVAAEKVAAQRKAEKRRTLLHRSMVSVAILLAAALLGYIVYQTQQAKDLPNPGGKPTNSSYAIPGVGNKNGYVVGDASAPVAVEIYYDTMCPHCADFDEEMQSFFDEKVAAKQIRLIYRPISFLSGYSVWGASAVGCAIDENKFVDYNTKLFEEQSRNGLDKDELEKLGADVGLTSDSFKTCVQDVRYQNWVLGSTQEARDRGVKGTPTIYVNGVDVSPDPKETKAGIDAAIEVVSGQ